jgi:hypothetical protein
MEKKAKSKMGLVFMQDKKRFLKIKYKMKIFDLID